MKRLTVLLTVLGLLLPIIEADLLAQANDKGKKGGPPGLEKKGGVPPGLQKKGGLPPGQAKKLNRTGERVGDEVEEAEESVEKAKQVKQEAPVVKAPTGTPEAPAPTTAKTSTEPAPPAPAVKPAAKKEAPPLTRVDPDKKVSGELQRRRDRLDENVTELNALAKNPESREKILDRLSRSTRLSVPELEAQMKQYPNLGVGDLYVANRIAKDAKQPVDRIIAQHEAGHSWGVLANEYRAGLGDLVGNTKETAAAARRAAK